MACENINQTSIIMADALRDAEALVNRRIQDLMPVYKRTHTNIAKYAKLNQDCAMLLKETDLIQRDILKEQAKIREQERKFEVPAHLVPVSASNPLGWVAGAGITPFPPTDPKANMFGSAKVLVTASFIARLGECSPDLAIEAIQAQCVARGSDANKALAKEAIARLLGCGKDEEEKEEEGKEDEMPLVDMRAQSDKEDELPLVDMREQPEEEEEEVMIVPSSYVLQK